jgi:predicted O-methyltransferase YrrM
MTDDLAIQVDEYFDELLVKPDPILEAALAAGLAAGMPQIQVSPTQGKFLHLLALIQGARRVLEVGTLAGYSTIWLGRALPPDGCLISLEVNPRYAEVARANLRRAGLEAITEVVVGPAVDSLAALVEGSVEPFDLVFIDADKERNPDYVGWALRLSHPGSVIVVDNVVRQGRVVDAENRDPNITGTRRMFENIAKEPRLEATAVQTVGLKGYDGFAVLRVKD